jgi:hypothetical protein
VTVIPEAIPTNPVCAATLYADLHTSLLFTTIDGAFAVGGALSVTTVEDTVFSANTKVGKRTTKSTINALVYFIIVFSK